MAEHVLSALTQGYQIANREVFLSASIGITLYPTDGRDVDILLRNADSAMYLAKERGRNTYHFFTEELNRRAQKKLHFENNLRQALGREEYQLYYQPQIDLVSKRIVGAEALLRWIPGQEPVNPTIFVPVLEETGLVVPVGKWVLSQACISVREWHLKGFKDLRVAVNLSARQLHQRDIITVIEKALQDNGLTPEFLEIEVTESTLVDSSISKQNLQRLEQLGVRLAIDDFGTGYSSLSYLKQYSVDVLKIDHTFIKDINRDEDDDAVTSAIVALSHRLGMKVVAEGVETLEQLSFLKKLQCDHVQGFLVARPMPKNQFEDWLTEYFDGATNNAYWVHSHNLEFLEQS